MPRLLALTALLPLLLVATPAAAAVTAKEKTDTCKVGADEQKLEGAKRKTFLAKCMGKGNYEPKARIDLKKKTVKVKRKPKPKAPVARPLLPAAAPAGRAASPRRPRPSSKRARPACHCKPSVEPTCRKPTRKVSATRPTRRRPRPAFSSKARTSSTGA